VDFLLSREPDTAGESVLVSFWGVSSQSERLGSSLDSGKNGKFCIYVCLTRWPSRRRISHAKSHQLVQKGSTLIMAQSETYWRSGVGVGVD
jgi:hypothetical protein